MKSAIRPFAIGLTALVTLWCAESCLSPGSLEHEETFRFQKDGQSSAGNAGAHAEGGVEQGCKAACTTFRTTCSTAGCHSTSDPISNLDLQSPGVVARLSGAPAQSAACDGKTLLVPGDPSKSLVYTKLLATPACGVRMPAVGMLTSSEIDCVRRWALSPSCDDGVPDASVGSGGAGGAGGVGGASNGGVNGTGGASSGGMNATGGVSSGGKSGSGGMNATGGKNSTGGKGGTGGMSSGGMSSGGMNGSGGMSATGSVVYVEAESGTLADPMVASMDSNASGGKYISVPSASATNADPTASTMGIATIPFTVKNSGNYAAFGRVITASTSSDSFWVKMDGGAWVQWNNLTNGTAWVWDDVHDSTMADAPVHYMLDPGNHTFYVAYREAAAELDKLVFATDAGFVPTGLGQ